MHRLIASVLVAGLFSSLALGQGQKGDKGDIKKDVVGQTGPAKKSPATTTPADNAIPGDVEILFLNGSKIRVVIQTEKLEIASIYGKLTVPIQDVQAIEF